MITKEFEEKKVEFRNRAEKEVQGRFEEGQAVPSMRAGEIQHILHELRVHQIELELQNEELMRVHHKLIESRDNYAALFDSAPLGYFTFDARATIIEVNLAGSALLGVERNELFSRDFRHFIYWEDEDIFYLFWKRLFNTKTPQSCEIRLNNNEGMILYVFLQSELIKNDDSNIARCRTIISDISARKLIENEHQNLLDQTLQLSAFKSEIILWVSHELKTPLVPIMGWTGFILSQISQGAPIESVVDSEIIKTLFESSKRLDLLIHQFLDIGRIEQHHFELERIQSDVRQLLLDAMQSVNFMRVQKKIEIDIQCETQSLNVDPIRMEQVFINILSNGIKYSQNNTIIHVKSQLVKNTKNSPTFSIEFRDEGLGFTPEEIVQATKPFEKFNSHNPQKQQIGGSGLGLYISKMIVEKHCGTLSIDSPGPNKGSTITISLPL